MTYEKRIAVVGTGYVGLVAGACFADWGNKVVCVDHDIDRVEMLKRGSVPIYEPGLADIIHRVIEAKRLSFTTKIADAVKDCDAAFIAVGTPPSKIDGEADLTQVLDCAQEIACSIRPGAVLVTKSTVPVGTGDMIERVIRKVRPDLDIAIASNPEFLREGCAIKDFTVPDRVVIGTDNPVAQETLSAIYEPVGAKGHRIVVTKRRSAELIKYASNAFLATKITFINEMADLCEAVDADVADIALGMGLDSRIGPHFLNAGPGYGGSCFPKDTLALVRTAQEYGVDLRIVEGTINANDARKQHMISKVVRALQGSPVDKTVAVLGLTFKADTDDMRESPAIPLVQLLQRAGASVRAYDPEGIEQASAILTDVGFYYDPYECAAGADAAVIMTDWEALKQLDLARLASLMRSPVLVDLRRIHSPEEAARHGFAVETIGRSGIQFNPIVLLGNEHPPVPADIDLQAAQ